MGQLRAKFRFFSASHILMSSIWRFGHFLQNSKIIIRCWDISFQSDHGFRKISRKIGENMGKSSIFFLLIVSGPHHFVQFTQFVTWELHFGWETKLVFQIFDFGPISHFGAIIDLSWPKPLNYICVLSGNYYKWRMIPFFWVFFIPVWQSF